MSIHQRVITGMDYSFTTLVEIRKPRNRDEKAYRYLRTDQEIARFLRAASDEDEHVYALYACAVYTGLRAGELAGLRWADVDLDRRLITVNRSFRGQYSQSYFPRFPSGRPDR